MDNFIISADKVKKTNRNKRYCVAGTLILLFMLHLLMSYQYTDIIWEGRKTTHTEFYVLKPKAYNIVSFGMNDTLSRLNVLYALYTPVNINIPSINFDRLITSLKGSSELDDLNIQPYLHIAYYWSWAKDNKSRLIMADYQKTGVDKFPESWDIPYSIYMLLRGINDEQAMDYIRIAAQRAAEFGGPNWIIDYPAIIMSRNGDLIQAILWLKETYEKTDNENHRKIIEEQLEKLMNKLEEEESKHVK